MSANKAPFIPAGTAGGDTRGLPALCASSRACAPPPRPGKGRRFSSFYTLLGFSPFYLLRVTSWPSLPPSPSPHPQGRWLRWVSPGSRGPLSPPYSLVQVSRSPSCGRKHPVSIPRGHPAGHSSSWQRNQGGFGVSGPPQGGQDLCPQCPAHGDHALPRLCTMQPRVHPVGAGGGAPEGLGAPASLPRGWVSPPHFAQLCAVQDPHAGCCCTPPTCSSHCRPPQRPPAPALQLGTPQDPLQLCGDPPQP